MLSLFLLFAGIEFGVEKSCSDLSVKRLNEPLTIVELPANHRQVFANGSIELKVPLPPVCTLVNTISTIQFDVSEAGEVVNIKLLNIKPSKIHARSIVKALKQGKVLRSAYGTKDNQLVVKYAQFESET